MRLPIQENVDDGAFASLPLELPRKYFNRTVQIFTKHVSDHGTSKCSL
jgi:hypothetical protein